MEVSGVNNSRSVERSANESGVQVEQNVVNLDRGGGIISRTQMLAQVIVATSVTRRMTKI